LKPQKVSK